MRSHDFFFISTCGFLTGVISGGIGAAPAISAILGLSIALVLIFIFKIRLATTLAVFCLFVAGNIYYAIDDYRYRETERAVESVTVFEGVVRDEARRGAETQTVKVEILTSDIKNAEGGRVYIHLETYPKISYGDRVSVSGTVVPPPHDSYGNYMAKEHVHGSLFSPDITVVGNDANSLLAMLFSVHTHIQNILGRLFTAQQAAFLSGIMLGDKDGFSPGFLQKLSVSGTTHLMALSGLNMTIIVFVALGIFSVVFWKRKRVQFVATFLTVGLFVAMTGFQVSAIRAALMAFLVGFAGISGRLYNPRNAIAFAALILTVWNPKAPVFDLGFQLSFLATISIIYLTPVLKRLSVFKTDGFLGWRDILAITLAAQLGVIPITIISFANFSFTSLLANIAVLAVIPLLTVGGFLIAAVSLLFEPLGILIAKPAAFLIDYVVLVVETFSVVRIPFNPEFGPIIALFYYAVLLWICWHYSPASRHNGS